MKAILRNSNVFFDGFFYFFGFIENPASNKIDEILDCTPAEKIKNDLKKIRKDYTRTYQNMYSNGNFMHHNNILQH